MMSNGNNSCNMLGRKIKVVFAGGWIHRIKNGILFRSREHFG